ncbi:hypothetical protein ATE80_00405 [Streptomyces kanasensis]|uniref:Uncharacterized protein n=1 Tax=Streptomyces kanasensis TaxID=936756 RepID=A0A117IXH5_9ACTN|nr:hypothetical protein ATE80_00405 [Streptomyces kanasensis]
MARLRAAERKLSEAPPARLDGQTAIRMVWRQDALWDDGAAAGVPSPPQAAAEPRRQPKARPARRRRRRHTFDHPARPVTRPRGDYTTGRRLTTVPLVGGHL